jgi:hypothetical protein
MASIPLTFVPPTEDDITTLHIYESNLPTSGFVEIDSTPAGVYPNYITEYTTANAASLTDWFAIQWSNAAGARSPLSAPIQGGQTTLIGEIVERVMLRARTMDLDENIVVQEAEATVAWVYKVSDPYSIDVNTVSPLWITELANLTLVASLYVNTTISSSGASSSYTAGMISETNTATQAAQTRIYDMIDKLEKRALRRLGLGGSLIASIDVSQYITKISGVKTAFRL